MVYIAGMETMYYQLILAYAVPWRKLVPSIFASLVHRDCSHKHIAEHPLPVNPTQFS
jgi:hypothetical protein